MKDLKTIEEYFEGMTEAEWDAAEVIEADIAKQLAEGFTEDESGDFVRTVINVRKTLPSATVTGVFNQALHLGLASIRYSLGKQTPGKSGGKVNRLKRPDKRGVRVVGVPGNMHGCAGVSIREA